MEEWILNTHLSDEHVAALRAVFDGPRWLTAPAGMRPVRPVEVKYSWHHIAVRARSSSRSACPVM